MKALVALLLFAPQDGIASLLDQLKSDEITVRETAHASLVEHGVKVLEVLAGRPVPADPEAASRIDAVVRTIVERSARTDWRAPVTLDAKDAPFASVVESLRKQSRFKIEVDDRNLPDDLTVERLRFDRVPFEQALATILEKAELDVLNTDADGIRIGRPAHLTFRFTKVDVGVIFKMASRLSGGITIRQDPEVAGTIDYACDNVAWTRMIDDVAARNGWVTFGSGPKEVRVRRRADFEKESKTESFPLVHLRPQDPEKDGPSRFATFVRSLESKLTRGASWSTVHGKWTYDPRRRAVVITDRAEVIADVARLVQELDRKPE
jgi:hypothetical protein